MGKFHKVEEVHLAEVANTLIKLLPKSSQLHNVVRLCLDGTLKKIVPTSIFAYDGVIDGKNAFVVARQDKWYYNDVTWVICPPKAEDVTDDMFCALEAIVDWTIPNSFNAVHADDSDKIEKMCTKYGKCRLGPCYAYWADQFTLNPPNIQTNGEDKPGNYTKNQNFSLKRLALDEAKTVVQHWKFAQDGTLAEIRDAIEFVESAGLYINADADGENKLVSWAYGSTDGSIHALFTLEEYRGKGYGKIVLETISRYLGQRGLYPTTHVESNNQSVVKLMECSGFKLSHVMNWVEFSPQK